MFELLLFNELRVELTLSYDRFRFTVRFQKLDMTFIKVSIDAFEFSCLL